MISQRDFLWCSLWRYRKLSWKQYIIWVRIDPTWNTISRTKAPNKPLIRHPTLNTISRVKAPQETLNRHGIRHFRRFRINMLLRPSPDRSKPKIRNRTSWHQYSTMQIKDKTWFIFHKDFINWKYRISIIHHIRTRTKAPIIKQCFVMMDTGVVLGYLISISWNCICIIIAKH